MKAGTFLDLCEDFLEDIPTIILTFLIDLSGKGLTPAGVLNITTSFIHLILNVIKVLTPKEKAAQETDEKETQTQKTAVRRTNARIY
eukprot:CAMPEP_0113298152 /NCGR_PEP_ID=MMETSP0010_2-20120614/718_1 /TAXON_ID=216773 ORGANISM="Corethron hystrix, Strain 308" /NCGR_SAMPLE_ID=MMETSP0010_2 /ASSEMBLY_ACC=CAM_ASM_000155 /LENGTH=86 /DNA_ID=CAMNT_0000151163 /DNA_START=350 /DNA_END=610 /DNA_ORIENTATION=- /assembly_acc=CAM_ASM_000155